MVVLMQGRQQEDLVIECQKMDRSCLKFKKERRTPLVQNILDTLALCGQIKDISFKSTQLNQISLINAAHLVKTRLKFQQQNRDFTGKVEHGEI